MLGYVENTTLSAIANAIRSKNGATTTYKPSEMAIEIVTNFADLDSAIIDGSITRLKFDDAYTGTIEEAALYGCNLKEVNLGSGIKSIEQGAFVSCDSLKSIHIPENVEKLYDVRFGISTNGDFDFTIYGKSGSAAETYAKENDITFIAE